MKNNFKLDKKNLEYIKENVVLKKIKNFFLLFLSILILTGALIISLHYLYEFPSEVSVKNDIQQIKQENKSMIEDLNMINKYLDSLRQEKDSLYITNLIPANEEINKRLRVIHPQIDYSILENVILYNKKRLENLNINMVSFDKKYMETKHLLDDSIIDLASLPIISPVSNPLNISIITGYGIKIHPLYNIDTKHQGIDFNIPVGTKVFSTATGVVKSVLFNNKEHGKMIIIGHGKGIQTVYGSLDKILVNKGDSVKRHQIIALSGNTGNSITPHLHYQIVVNGKPVNPSNYFLAGLNSYDYFRLNVISSNKEQKIMHY
ncbi:MAG: M23 family metallopeptidase [Marinilabiliales bacterium]